MTVSHTSREQKQLQTRKVSIQERSVQVGTRIVVNSYRVNRAALKARFTEGGYQIQETAHFLLLTRKLAPSTILVHWFAPDTPLSAIQAAMMEELAPFELLQQADEQQELLGGIVDSFKMQNGRLYDRSVKVGNTMVMSGFGLDQYWLKQRFLNSGYQVQGTPHFLFCTRDTAPSPILIHWFAPQDLHSSISSHLVEELKPFGCIPNNERQAEMMTGIIETTYPGDVRRAWNYFGTNTLRRLLALVSTASPEISLEWGTLEASATLYQRVLELCAGKRFLDAACNGGFFALLLAEQRPFVQEVVGVDIDGEVFRVGKELARARNLSTVRFVQADLLSDEIEALGTFDTVTALHVLEHFTEEDMYRVLDHLLHMTLQHLIVAVPYEETPTAAYDHLQCFSPAKLEQVGKWCIERLGGAGQMWCEERGAAGNLLLIERLA
jgi:SAM-dependent methyltransferase